MEAGSLPSVGAASGGEWVLDSPGHGQAKRAMFPMQRDRRPAASKEPRIPPSGSFRSAEI